MDNRIVDIEKLEDLKQMLIVDIEKLICTSLTNDKHGIERLRNTISHSVSKVKDISLVGITIPKSDDPTSIPNISIVYSYSGDLERITLNVDLDRNYERDDKYWTLD